MQFHELSELFLCLGNFAVLVPRRYTIAQRGIGKNEHILIDWRRFFWQSLICTQLTFSMASFILSEVNSSLSTLWSSPESSLMRKMWLIIQQSSDLINTISNIHGFVSDCCVSKCPVSWPMSIKAEYFCQDLPSLENKKCPYIFQKSKRTIDFKSYLVYFLVTMIFIDCTSSVYLLKAS